MNSIKKFLSLLHAAIYWYCFGFQVIPIFPGTKRPAVKWDPWLAKLSQEAISAYWERHPDHEVGFIVGDDFIVFDADSPEPLKALAAFEQEYGAAPIKTVSDCREAPPSIAYDGIAQGWP